jgi:hypothetical protein
MCDVEMTITKCIEIGKAIPIGTQEISDVKIKITPNALIQNEGNVSVAEYNTFYELQAETLYQALRNSLPGGTLDRLMCKLMQNKCTSFKVLL